VRTTLTLDDDVAALLKKEARSRANLSAGCEPISSVGANGQETAARKAFKVTPINLGLPPYTKVEEMLESLEGPDYR